MLILYYTVMQIYFCKIVEKSNYEDGLILVNYKKMSDDIIPHYFLCKAYKYFQSYKVNDKSQVIDYLKLMILRIFFKIKLEFNNRT